MLKTYRITFRSEVFIQAVSAEDAQRAFENGGVCGADAEYVEQSSAPEEYCSPYGSPVEGGDDE